MLINVLTTLSKTENLVEIVHKLNNVLSHPTLKNSVFVPRRVTLASYKVTLFARTCTLSWKENSRSFSKVFAILCSNIITRLAACIDKRPRYRFFNLSSTSCDNFFPSDTVKLSEPELLSFSQMISMTVEVYEITGQPKLFHVPINLSTFPRPENQTYRPSPPWKG